MQRISIDMDHIISQIKHLVEDRLGQPLRYSADCEVLAQSICDATGQHLGVTTLKRMFGFSSEKVVAHRASTLDILALYLGFANFESLQRHICQNAEVSDFANIRSLDIPSLPIGSHVTVTYAPDRLLELKYLGLNHFRVIKATNSKLLKDDTLRIAQLAIGFELLATEVTRRGQNIGEYRAAKGSGLSDITLGETL